MGIIRHLKTLLPLPKKWEDDQKAFGLRLEDAYRKYQTDKDKADALIDSKLDKANVYNGLDKTDEGFALDARQGAAISGKADKIFLMMSDNTWEKIWNKIDALSPGDTATIYINNTPWAILTGGARTSGSPSGTVLRISNGRFYFLLHYGEYNTFNDVITASIEGCSSSSAGTYSDSIRANSMSAMAILADGNTHVAISEGEYVFVRHHSTLTEGLYVATSNIAENGTLSSSNLTSADGVLNTLSESIATLSGKIVSHDLGMSSTLPSTVPNGLVGFGLSSSVTLDNVSIPAGTRFFGYMASSIGHFVGIPNATSIYIVRKESSGWRLKTTIS